MTGLSLAPASTIRARGHVAGGGDGSSWFVESYAGTPFLLAQPADRTNLVGSMATFTVQAVGTEPHSFQWRKDGIALVDGGNIAGATTATLTMDEVAKGDNGEYSVVVINALGATESEAATLQVLENDAGWQYPGGDWRHTMSFPASSDAIQLGQLRSIASFGVPGSGSTTLRSGDVDGDGRIEVVCVRGATVSVFNHEFQFNNQFEIALDGMARINGLILEDIDGNGTLDIVVGFVPGNNNNRTFFVRAFDSRGNLVREFRRSDSGDGSGMFPLVKLGSKLILGSSAGFSRTPRGLSAWDCDSGTILWEYRMGSAQSSAGILPFSVADLNGDDLLDIPWPNATVHNGASANGTSDGDCYSIIVDEDGNRILSQIYSGGSSRDGKLWDAFVRFRENDPYHLVTLKGYDPTYYRGTSRAHLRSATGDILNTVIGLANANWDCGIADVDGDGVTEVIANSRTSSASRQFVMGEGFVVEHENNEHGALMAISDLDGDGRSEIILGVGTQLKVLDSSLRKIYQRSVSASSAIVSDVNGDGRNEILVGGSTVDVLEAEPSSGIRQIPETFESGWGGWWTDDETVWMLGEPVVGPPLNPVTESRAHSPASAIATVLDGNYPANKTARLVSPPFVVPPVDGQSRVTLRFWQWRQYGTGDRSFVQVLSQYENDWITLAETTSPESSPDWELATIDLTPYQRQEIRIGFLHSADGDSSRGAGWFIDDVSLSSATPLVLELGSVGEQQFTDNRQSQYFLTRVPSGGHLRFRLDDLDDVGINEFYIRRASLPSAGSFDYRFPINGGADQEIFVPDAGAGDWYILAYNESGPVPGGYTVQVEHSTGVIVDRASPERLANTGLSFVSIYGAGFSPDATVQLTGPTNVWATDVSLVAPGELLAEFNLAGVTSGAYQLNVTSGTNSDSLPFEVTQGIGAKLETRLVLPSRVGYHNTATIYIEYSNTGDTAMPAPLLTLTPTQNGKPGALLTLDRSVLTRGFWTAAIPEGFSTSIQILADGAISGILQPGETMRVPVYYAGWLKPWDFRYPPVYFGLNSTETANDSLIDWAAHKDGMRPPSIPSDAWDAIWENFLGSVGSTWGDYVAMLSENASYLGRLGIDVSDVGDLLAFEFAQAEALNVIGTLAGATDAFAPAPGLNLTFTRTFGQTITSRNRLGDLGYGWRHNWDARLIESGDGTIVIGAGRNRTFQPDSRDPNHYFASPGDTGVLTPRPGGGFLLTEADGATEGFAANGLLEYRQDFNGNRITTTYSGNQLTRLTHSSGQFLEFTWNGAGLVQTVTDQDGRTATYTYDGGLHLVSVQNFDGSVVSYSYVTGDTAPRNHALTTITYPGGTHLYFTYDARGRLASSYRDGRETKRAVLFAG